MTPAPAIALTVWYCIAAQPKCDPSQDPTGPPITVPMPNIEACEAYYRFGEAHYPKPSELIVRHTCTPSGDDI